MTPNAYATLVNLAGFITGGALYGMLLVMVLRAPPEAYALGALFGGSRPPADRLPLLTAVLGLAWNVVAAAGYALPALGVARTLPLVVAIGHCATFAFRLDGREWERSGDSCCD